MDPAFKGKTSILNIPSIGIMDAAMIMEAMGNITYADKGNMTKEEIDATINFLIKAKQDGQFRAFWKSFDESVNLMSSGEVVIQSMWSPAVAAVRSKGIPCTYQPLKEGYRSWGGGLGLAAHLSGAQLDAAYEYINWYTSGWVGGYLNRQGYYSAAMDTAKQFMSEDEWGFWIEGKPAAGDILNPDGVVMEKAGAVRDGGSFLERMGQRRLLELGDGRGPLHGHALERVHRGVSCEGGVSTALADPLPVRERGRRPSSRVVAPSPAGERDGLRASQEHRDGSRRPDYRC